MKRVALVLMVFVVTFAACSPPGTEEEPSATGTADFTPLPGDSEPVGGTYKIGTRVKTEAGSYLTVLGWTKGAPEGRESTGPGQVYETIGLIFCAGPDVDVTGREIVPLFSLELPNGNRVSPDSLTGKGEMRTKGRVKPGTCTRGPIVFQVGGGTKPKYVVFESTPKLTKWTVP